MEIVGNKDSRKWKKSSLFLFPSSLFPLPSSFGNLLPSIKNTTMLWPYVTPGIPDDLFERLPGIPMSKREVRLLLLSHLRLQADSVVWDIGAGTGTIAVETGLLCPKGRIIAVERDEEVASLIRRNCDRFELNNVEVIEGSAPECLENLSQLPHRVCIEGGRPIKKILKEVWRYLQPHGRVVATASNLENLYALSESFAELQVRNIEVVQSAVNRLETRGLSQTFAAVNPIFILSGEKLD
jgi:cobalt-precorrin-6B (C15)-methyltransferase